MTTRRTIFALTILFNILFSTAFAAVNIADFARFSEFDTIKISPDGSYLAAGVNDKEGKRSIVIINMKTKKVTAHSSFSGRTRPGNFF